VSSVIISVSNMSKAYSIYKRPVDMLTETITGRKNHDIFWALRDINFEVAKTERVGIIGANGSGKSTLLKIITGHLQATTGSVQVNGGISAMLSLNTVLSPEETGLANIRFNLILNGCPKALLAERTEDIIEFTELGPFIYAPVKTYSSGMNAKLAFAITTAIEPDILVIDEVLSVGDSYFMGKATHRMKELCDRGNGLLFVSHSTSAVQMLCDKVLWMENGSVRMYGDTDYVIKSYEEDYRKQEDLATRKGNASRVVSLAKTVTAADLLTKETIRFRLVGAVRGGTITDTHYVSRIAIKLPTGLLQEIPLDLPLILESSGNSLDVLSSEWGRLYEHDNRACRVLTPKTGKRSGGHILLSQSFNIFEQNFYIEVESNSISGYESLVLEKIDFETGLWVPCDLMDKQVSKTGWEFQQFLVSLEKPDETSLNRLAESIEVMASPHISIINASIIIFDNEETSVISEREPFSIRVQIQAREKVEQIDVGIKILRDDGVYVFWQSSGFVGQQIGNLIGNFNVEFDFTENNLGSGSYVLTAYVANVWDFPANYPYSEVYDRKVGIMQFKVLPESAGLDMGLINQRVPCRIL